MSYPTRAEGLGKYDIYIYVYKQDLTLDNTRRLICHKTLPNHSIYKGLKLLPKKGWLGYDTKLLDGENSRFWALVIVQYFSIAITGAGDRTETVIFWPSLLWPSRCVFLVLQGWGPLCWVLAFFTASYQHLLWTPIYQGPKPLRPGVAFPTTSPLQLPATWLPS